MESTDVLNILLNDPYTKIYKPKLVFSDELPERIPPDRYDSDECARVFILYTRKKHA